MLDRTARILKLNLDARPVVRACKRVKVWREGERPHPVDLTRRDRDVVERDRAIAVVVRTETPKRLQGESRSRVGDLAASFGVSERGVGAAKLVFESWVFKSVWPSVIGQTGSHRNECGGDKAEGHGTNGHESSPEVRERTRRACRYAISV